MLVARFFSCVFGGVACLSAGVLACMLSACNAFDPGALDRLQGMIEMPVRDGGRDAAVPCIATLELCNALDDDCDGKTDETADVACFEPNTTSVCATGGRCVVIGCDDEYLDCNDRDDDGCEQPRENGPCPCEGGGCDAGMDGSIEDAGPADAEVEDAADDAEVEVEAGPQCQPTPEVCDGVDNNCNDQIDETPECAIERCVDTAPSYRGEECDRCACEKCDALIDDCQAHQDETWRTRCDDVVECYVVEDRAGNCDPPGNCYGTGPNSGTGPCAGEINLASGGESEDDGSQALAGCTPAEPTTTPCMAVTNYRDLCILSACADECAQ